MLFLYRLSCAGIEAGRVVHGRSLVLFSAVGCCTAAHQPSGLLDRKSRDHFKITTICTIAHHVQVVSSKAEVCKHVTR